MAKVNDVVLLYLEDSPVSFARVEDIKPDAKKDWYQIRLLMLQIPLQVVTWILKDDYINGDEFNMNGKKMKLEKVESPVEDLQVQEPETIPENKKSSSKNKSSKIISFADLKKKHEQESG